MPKRIPTYRPPWVTKKPEARPSSHARGYGSTEWQRTRLAVIARDMGMCRMCGILVRGERQAQIDHIDRKPTDQAAQATPLDRLQLLCLSCHSKKTAAEGAPRY